MTFGLNFNRSKSGDSRTFGDFQAGQKTAYGAYNYGAGLTDEGLTGLRSLDSNYQQQLTDPLGAVGRGIFARARGALSDDAVRAQRSGTARIFQQAVQSGGTLSPEAQAELQTRNQRGIDESLFSGEANIANSEASMTLDQTNKLFDRMADIRKTILGIGQDERTRGLQNIVAMLSARTNIKGSYGGGVNVGGG